MVRQRRLRTVPLLLSLVSYLSFSNICLVNALTPAKGQFNLEADHHDHPEATETVALEHREHDEADDDHAHEAAEHNHGNHSNPSSHDAPCSDSKSDSCCSQFLQDFPILLASQPALANPEHSTGLNIPQLLPADFFSKTQAIIALPDHGPPKATNQNTYLTSHSLRAPPSSEPA